MLSVITRTSNRPNYFKNCRESVLKQTIPVEHITISDSDESYMADLQLVLRVTKRDGEYPYNLYFNEAKDYIISDYVMFLDDDDMFTKPDSAEIILNNLDEDTLLLWKVRFGMRTIPETVPGVIEFGKISGIGFAYHKKHWVDWQNKRGGDYLVIKELSEKLKVKWIDEVLTGLQHPLGMAGMAKGQDL